MKLGKRIVTGLLALLTLALAVLTAACQKPGDGTETSAVTSGETSSETSAETEGTVEVNGLYGWFDYGTALYLRDRFSIGTTTEGIAFQMAKNEKEGFQYLLTASEDYTDLRCEVTDLSDGAGHTLPGEVNVVWYLWVQKADAIHERGFTPCMMLPQDDPYQDGTFDVEAGTARTLFVRYETDKDTIPGTYTGTLTVKQGSETLLSGEVSVRVRDIYYDEKTECLSEFGLGYDPYDQNSVLTAGPESAEEIKATLQDERWRIYAEYMLDNRLMPNGIKAADLLTDDGAAYMANPRVGLVDLSNPDQGALRELYQKATEQGWIDKLCFCYGDEPLTEADYNYLRAVAAQQQRLFPSNRFLTAYGENVPIDGKNATELFGEFSTIHCLNVGYDRDKNKGVLFESLKKLQQERGDTVIWYVCGEQTFDTVNLLPCTPGTDKRVLFWQQYQHDVDGFLYWRVTFWNTNVFSEYNVDVWSDDYLTAKRKFPKAEEGPTDDGVLLYWHPTTGLPVSTLGFEAVRDGIEDFQLMKMAERAVGRGEVLKTVERITTGIADYVRYENGSTELLENLKAELFDVVESVPAA